MSTVTPLPNEVTIFQHNNTDTVKKYAIKPKVDSKSKQTKSNKADDFSGAAKHWSSRRVKDKNNTTAASDVVATLEEGGNEETSQRKN